MNPVPPMLPSSVVPLKTKKPTTLLKITKKLIDTAISGTAGAVAGAVSAIVSAIILLLRLLVPVLPQDVPLLLV